MLAKPRYQEIDHRTIKLLVGTIALTLPILTSNLSPVRLASISESYWIGDWTQSIFVGFLFAIAALVMSYNGRTTTEMVMSKCAAVSALGVALFPCECDCHPERIHHAHAFAASIMFGILTYFCILFYQRAIEKGHREAKWRAAIYAICGAAIVASIVLLALENMRPWLRTQYPRWVFYWEATGLFAFGISWLTASRTLPIITQPTERFHPLGEGPANNRELPNQ